MRMLTSIIIPHYNREPHLIKCLASIDQASLLTPRANFEVVIVGRTRPIKSRSRVRYIKADPFKRGLNLLDEEVPPFWKTRLLNIGMDEANGETLTFLDADAIVGPRFLAGAEYLASTALTKLCYRVRYTGGDTPWHYYNAQINKKGKVVDKFRKAHEAYGSPERGHTTPDTLIFGNSQFSITRGMLGSLRWNENYFGRGFEDIDMLHRIWRAHNSQYTAEIMTDGDRAMFHLDHKYDESYGFSRWCNRNRRRYYREPMHWIVSGNGSVSKEAKVGETVNVPLHSFVDDDDDHWQCEVNKGLDMILTIDEAMERWVTPK